MIIPYDTGIYESICPPIFSYISARGVRDKTAHTCMCIEVVTTRYLFSFAMCVGGA